MTAVPTPGAYQPGGDLGGFVSKWIKIWVAFIGVVTLVAVIYLVAIVRTLSNINGNLAVAQNAVVDVGGETKTLPRQVGSVNVSLAGIDEDVKPIQANTQKIRASLTSIQGKLVNVDTRLVNIRDDLRSVLGDATGIQRTLVAAQRVDSEGTNLIFRQVGGRAGSLERLATVNGQLDRLQGDTGDPINEAINRLRGINNQLDRICDETQAAATALLVPSTCR
ncbi:MAG TPA: hypothetical protein VK988_01895 [Acidimicrobiales bacterium]|nr:hypothetical protein [Acidimicrobiales bacterium]